MDSKSLKWQAEIDYDKLPHLKPPKAKRKNHHQFFHKRNIGKIRKELR